ncbi:MAG: LLM class flavin-dependent oxidoreductase [Pseudonocardiales bacterium]
MLRRSLESALLDLAPVGDGTTAQDAVRATVELAKHADEQGFTRFWLAEHHSMPGIASSAPAVLIGAVAAATKTIRVGSGGVMLPNHAPLVIAEQFGTLAALHPGRIDLGLGRAPGTDRQTAAALRRSAEQLGPDDFPQQLGELACFLAGEFPDAHPYRAIRAVPHATQVPPIWLLGSSLYSAELAGVLGLPFAFAHHFSGTHTLPALERYRTVFRPSAALDEPYAIVTVQAVCAPDDATAQRIALPAALSFLRLRQGRPGQLPTPEQAAAHPWSPEERAFAAQRREGQAIGGPTAVREALATLLDATAADELMLSTLVHSPADRLRSTELIRGMFGDLPTGLGQAAAAF